VEPARAAETAGPPGDLLGDDVVYGACTVRSYKHADGGFALVFDDTGRFDISADGRRITWYQPDDAIVEAARADIMGRVLALAMHAMGIFTVHASAVSIRGSGVAFVGPKFHGKSTLAAALVRLGAKLITDDTLPVRLDTHQMLPGVHHLRLWSDSADRTVRARKVESSGSRKLFAEVTDRQLEQERVPAGALYVLVPQTPRARQPPARRERLGGVAATMALVQHAKLAPLLRGAEAGVLFSQAASLADHVHVYALLVQRDLEQLIEAAELVRSWHAPQRGDSASPA
jgi:hypothetical protein